MSADDIGKTALTVETIWHARATAGRAPPRRHIHRRDALALCGMTKVISLWLISSRFNSRG